MSGHSHWARIKRAKSVTDARRGRAWSKLARAVIIAARQGGGDPETNLSLRYAIDAAKAENMPKDTIERAIKKGTGEIEGAEYVELVFEGYGPGGAAILCAVLTDNRNRTAPEIRRIFENAGGSLGSPGSVAWMFEKKGVISVKLDAAEEDALLDIILEAGAEDLTKLDGVYEITCEVSVFSNVQKALAEHDITPETAELTNIASQNVTPSTEDARKVLRLMEEFEDHDDVSNVSANFEITAELMAEME